MDQDWIAVFHPDHTPFDQGPNSPMRGSWFLYVWPDEFPGVWTRIRDSTENGGLGYRSSFCQNLQDTGQYLICVFGLLQEIWDIKDSLDDFGLGEYIEEFRLIHEFRNSQIGKQITEMVNQFAFQ